MNRPTLASLALCLVVLALPLAPASTAQTVISADTTIDASNLDFEGLAVVVDGAVLTLSGTHRFQSLHLTNGATLTHPPATPTPPELILEADLGISEGSAINLNGKGHPGGLGEGAGPDLACCTAGGSHGGSGGFGRDGGRPTSTYGSIVEPFAPGSGGGVALSHGTGGSGGGALKLVVGGILQNDGRIETDGTEGGDYAGGGSGGSLWIVASQIRGAGVFSAVGGDGFPLGGGGGGGGRIALHYAQDTFAGQVLVHGGDGSQIGGAGTIYRKPDNSPRGLVLIDNAGKTNGVTEVDRDFTLAADLRILRGGVLATRFDTNPTTLRLLGNVTVETQGTITASGRGLPHGFGPGTGPGASCCTAGASHAGSGGIGHDGLNPGANYGSITHPIDPGSGAADASGHGDGGDGGGALRIILGGDLQVDGRIESDGGNGGNFAGGGSGGSLWISGPSFTGGGTISVAGGNGLPGNAPGGAGGGGGRIAVHVARNTFTGSYTTHGGDGSLPGGGGTTYLKLDASPRGQVIIDNGGKSGGFTEVDSTFSTPDDLVIRNGGILAPRVGETPWTLHFPANVHIQPGGAISATARGFAGGEGAGTTEDVPSHSAGGSHGGKGGTGLAHVAVTTHGDPFQPVIPGSGAGNTTGYGDGGRGGGAIRLTVDGELRVDGRLEADGGVGGDYAGGGSGGSLFVTATLLSGSGRISATGGDASVDATGGGGGGGGRIALYIDAMDDALRDQLTAGGGNGIQQGGGGTLFLKNNSEPIGEFIVDRSPLDKDTGPTEFWGEVVIPAHTRIRSGGIVAHPQGHPFHLGIRGNLVVASGAQINLDGLGYLADGGPGSPLGNGGAGHAGPGGEASEIDPGGLGYGDSEDPIDLGSGAGNGIGGGAGRLSVQGTLRVDGSITANGIRGTTGAGSSGGSLLIDASQVVGDGFITADGAEAAGASFGGGSAGRIVLRYRGEAFPALQISAKGGTGFQPGSDGTVLAAPLAVESPPSLVSALASPSLTEVAVAFSDVLDWSTAETPANYTLNGSAQVLGAELQSDLRTVLLTTSPLAGGVSHTLTVTGLRNGLGTSLAGNAASATFIARGTVRGLVRQEVFTGIPGSRLSQLYASPKWPLGSNSTRDVSRVAASRDDIDGNNLGARLTGYLIPETTGWHRFFMTSDDNGIFYLSEDHSPARLRLVASEPLSAFPGDWIAGAQPAVTASRGVPPANISMPVWLRAGRHYWFDARMKEGTATEHLAVTWQAPGDSIPLPNEGTRLAGDRIARPIAGTGPQVSVQPAGGTFNLGDPVTFRVSATGTGPLRYQWYFNGTPRPGDTGDTLTLPSLTVSDFGSYRVRVTDTLGVVDSSPALVARAAPMEPVFARQPQGRVANLGENVVLDGFGEGAPPLTYQWRLNGQDIPGATSPTLSIPGLRRADAGTYTLVAVNAHGARESDPARIELALPLLAFSDSFAQRLTLTQTNGIGTTNNVSASSEAAAGEPRHAGKRGGRSLWAAWRAPASGVATLSTTGSSFDTLLAVYTGTVLGSLQPIASDEDSGGFLTSELRFNAVAGTEYQMVIDGFAGATGVIVFSWNLDPDLPVLPSLLEQPGDRLAIVGDPIEFRVTFTPAGTSVQWFFNDSELPGRTDPILRFDQAAPSLAGTYRARLRTPAGAILDSGPAVLEVADRPLAAASLSADKLDDLFLEDEAASPGTPFLHGLVPGPGLPVAVGLPGSQWTDNSASSRSADDPAACSVTASATRWFRIRFNVPGGNPTTIRLSTTGTEMPTFLAAFTNRANLRMVACDAAEPPSKPAASIQFGAFRGVDYLVMVDGIAGGRGPIRLNWEGEEEAPPLIALQDGRFHVEFRVAPAIYDWQVADALGSWETLLRTNLPSGIFQFEEPTPALTPARFFRLIPTGAGSRP